MQASIERVEWVENTKTDREWTRMDANKKRSLTRKRESGRFAIGILLGKTAWSVAFSALDAFLTPYLGLRPRL
jgi:hypothetical protein